MASTNPALGLLINKQLEDAGLETPFVKRVPKNTPEIVSAIANSFDDIMRTLGLNLMDDSLGDTPQRVAKMYAQEIFYGLNYANFPKCTTVENKMGYDEVINSNLITVHSVCEHHFQPFIGTASIAYIPKDKILGLSKFNRIVDFFSRRPQIQERLTEQISAALRHILDTDDVAVVIRAEHMCVKLRGVQDASSDTVTSKMCGRFKTVPELRAEFFAISHNT